MAEKRLRYAFIGDADSLLRAINKSDTALGGFTRSVGKIGSAAVTGFGILSPLFWVTFQSICQINK